MKRFLDCLVFAGVVRKYSVYFPLPDLSRKIERDSARRVLVSGLTITSSNRSLDSKTADTDDEFTPRPCFFDKLTGVY